MQTLDAPVYEVNQDSQWYKDKVKQLDDYDTFFRWIHDTYGKEEAEGFVFYSGEHFGVSKDSPAYDHFKNDIKKNPDTNGIYMFKKRSPHFAIIKAELEKIQEINPFKRMDEFGLNNTSASQWIGDRWFYGVKHDDMVKGSSVTPIPYSEYLKLVTEHVEKEEAKTHE